jgi:hypothetical protein
MIFKLNDILTTKKPHVCGSNEWKILRTGIDFKLICIKCSREIMIGGNELAKKVKQVKHQNEEN